jgi:hypothetical protein
MRWLRIAYRLSRAGRPVLLSATLLGGCDGTTRHPVDAPVSPDTDDARIIILKLDTVPYQPYDAPPRPDVPVVPSPAVDGGIDGGTALPAGCLDIDAGADAGLSLPGGQAARVTMTSEPIGASSEGTSSVGRVTLAPEIAGLVVGLPDVQMVDKHPSDAPDASISNVRPDSGGFLFDVLWTGYPASLCLSGVQPDWTFRTVIRLQCGGQERAVESLTTVMLCGYGEWASSGDACDECTAIAEMAPSPARSSAPDEECATICEMAPSPLVAATAGDELPLGSALGVVVRPVARIGGAVVLVAEHEPRQGVTYRWQTTAGKLEALAPDVVLWRPVTATPARAQLAQVAVTGEHFATVASYRCDRRAA